MATTVTSFIDVTLLQGTPTVSDSVFIPEIWETAAVIQREAKTVFGGLIDRRFEEGVRFGKVHHIPTLGNLSSQDKSENTAVSYETVTETLIDITVNTHKYVAVAVEDLAEVQANRDMLQAYAGKQAYALALALDDSLAALVDTMTNKVGTLAVELDADDWVRAIQYLDDENVPDEDRFAIIPPAQKSGLLKMDKYISNDYASVHGDAPATRLENAYTRSFFDIPVYVTTNVDGSNTAGHDSFLGHKETLAAILQMKPRVRAQYDVDFTAMKVVMQEAYGVKLVRDDATYSTDGYGNYGVWMRSA